MPSFTYSRRKSRSAPPRGTENPAPEKMQGFQSSSPALVTAVVPAILTLPGQPLEPSARVEMERRFRHDFSQVRIHTDEQAARAAELLEAKAFTVGSDIFFAPGAYRPSSESGRWLLAHELAHTIQQGPHPLPAHALAQALRIESQETSREAEARRAAQQTVDDDIFGVVEKPSATHQALGEIARQATRLATPERHTTLWQPAQRIDPAQILTRLVEILLQSLRNDPEDQDGRVRRQLERLAEPTRREVLEQARERMTEAEWSRLARILEETLPPGMEPANPDVSQGESVQETPTEEGARPSEGTRGEEEVVERQPEAEAEATAERLPEGETEERAEGGETEQPEAEQRPQEAQAERAEARATLEQTPEEAGREAQAEPGPETKAVDTSAAEAAAEEEGQPAPEAQAAMKPGSAPAGAVAVESSGGTSGEGLVTIPPALAAEPKPRPVVSRRPEAIRRFTLAMRPAPEVEQAADMERTATQEAQVLTPNTLEQAIAGPEAPPAMEEAAEPAGLAEAAPKEARPRGPQAEEATGGVPPLPTEPESLTTPQEQPESPAAAVEAPTGETEERSAPAAEEPQEEPAALREEPNEEQLQATALAIDIAQAAGPEEESNAGAHAPGTQSPSQVGQAEVRVGSATETVEEQREPATTQNEQERPSSGTNEAAPVEGAQPLNPMEPTSPSLAQPAAEGGEAGAVEAPAAAEEVAPGSTEPTVGQENLDIPASAELPNSLAPTGEVNAAAAPSGTEGEPACAPGAAGETMPAAAEGGGGACGGGGGGGGSEPQPAAEPPNVSQADPQQAMASVSNLPPVQMQRALGGVSSAVSNTVTQQRQELSTNPPTMERPSGVPATRDPTTTPTVPPPPRGGDRQALNRVPQGAAQATPPPQPLPPAPAPATQNVSNPRLPGDTQLSPQDVQQVQVAVHSLPVTDPALNVNAGDPPELVLEGNASPERARAQRTELDNSTRDTQSQGRRDAAEPLGENDVYPTVPPESLRAEVQGGGEASASAGGNAGREATSTRPREAGPAGGGAGAADDDSVGIIAEAERGDQVRAAAGDARSQMQSGQQEHTTKVAEERANSQRAMDEEVQRNADDQSRARANVRRQVQEQRGHWTEEQQQTVDSSRQDADREGTQGSQDIQHEQTQAQSQARQHIQDGNRDIGTARQTGERQAASERQRAERETSSGGFFSWLSSRVTSFFDGIKRAIHAAFEAARRAVRTAIERAQRLAAAVIERARQAIVSAIRRVGDALIAIGDRLLAAFPRLRDRFRRAIRGLVERAVSAVNELADRLKRGIQNLLNLLGRALDAALGLLERAYMAAIDAVNRAVQGAIQFARSVVEALAAFAQLIKDIAADPGQWLRNLGRSVVEGIRNCLWDAFKTAVRNWFSQKVEEVLGLGMMIWRTLTQGCMTLAQIGTMAWEGLKAAIPMVLIQLLIEKLVSMIVPAAGAIMTIIEGLRAAWGTVSRIITAFQLFFDFLKAVKTGNAAGKFAAAVAAAAVVVIDFVANWLLMRLRRPAGAIAGRLRALAQRIGSGLRRAGQAARRGAMAVARAARTAGRATVTGARRAARAVVAGTRRAARAIGRRVAATGRALARTRVGQAVRRRAAAVGRAIARSPVGRAVVRAYRASARALREARARFQAWRQRTRERWQRRREERRQGRQRDAMGRLQRAVRAIRPALTRALQSGSNRLILRARLLYWRIRYRLAALQLQSDGTIIARVNPEEPVLKVKPLDDPQILLARDLEEIFAEAEQAYEAQLSQQPGAAREEYRAARSRIVENQPGEAGFFAGTGRDVQAALLRENLITPGRFLYEPGVTARYRGSHLGRLEIEHAGSYPTFARRLSTGPQLDIPEREIARILSTSNPTRFQQELQRLEGAAGQSLTQTAREKRLRFIRRIRRGGPLTQAVEPARQRGVSIPTHLGYILAASERASIQDIAGREGKFGIMTPRGAASQTESSERESAVRQRYERSSNVIQEIRSLTRNQILTLESGANVDAFRRALLAYLRRSLARDRRELIRQVIIFLRTHHGR